MVVTQAAESLFDASRWDYSTVVSSSAGGGGRGATRYVSSGASHYVLRHYYRGGMPRRVLKDRYLWCGEDRTRSFREFRLLDQALRWQLPVPAPAAARYSRTGLIYRADLLTEKLHDVSALSGVLAERACSEDEWRGIGATIRRFHDRGVCHADLNAHNIQLGPNGDVFLLDFDRGSIRKPGRWPLKNLSRLKRSLQKISRNTGDIAFSAREWSWLMAGYAGSSTLA